MNDGDILSQLRDIHLPSELIRDVTASFALWPFAVLGGLVAMMLLVRLWRGQRWRHRARAEFAEILALDDQDTQWTRLLVFAEGWSARSGRSLTLPDVAFARPDRLTDTDRASLIDYLRAELKR
ncbi:MAG: hypothetical protein AAF493_13120 [Pseudomonadota bacterium]